MFARSLPSRGQYSVTYYKCNGKFLNKKPSPIWNRFLFTGLDRCCCCWQLCLCRTKNSTTAAMCDDIKIFTLNPQWNFYHGEWGGGRVGTTHHAGQPIPSPANQTAAGLIPRCKHLYMYLPPQLLADRKLYTVYSVLRYRVIHMHVYKRESVTRSLALFCPDSNPSGRVFNPIKVCLKYNLLRMTIFLLLLHCFLIEKHILSIFFLHC